MSGMISSLRGMFDKLQDAFWSILNQILPPEKRAEIMQNLKNFAVNNPKLAAFLTTQIAFSGIPLVLFITFSITVFLFSLIAAVLVAVLVAVLFTIFIVGLALLIALPTLFFTSFSATFVFLWGLGGYYILKWANDGEAPAPDGKAIGDKLNDMTGGRMSWLTNGSRKKQEDLSQGINRTVEGNGAEKDGDGRSEDDKSHSTNGTAHTTGAQKHDGANKENESQGTDGGPRKLNKPAVTNGTNTAKGATTSTVGTI
ncbi:hypothetical protein K491DRAFT_663898 [Lophiostoma macrostomum CBS 122681]|uniref:Uncharacterized protein n=1 Tax=Lophiostoma macrostomum CBS 122681 TaxID=1314788 RepID=A0A6A6SX68_9PLEO|nr:hypothetical protein K491DRAFT_663898 [Lophiostoma macrostomum CBS 122681]